MKYFCCQTILISVVFLLLIYLYSIQIFQVYAVGIKDDDSLDNFTINGIKCYNMEHINFHIHTLFTIFINNTLYPIPKDVGIVNPHCLYSLHTHDNSGLIHVESPITKEFTLGQFLQIWDEYDDADIVKDISNNNINGTIDLYINGIKITDNRDFRNIILKDGELITLRILD